MRTIRLIIGFNGTNYCGWQSQKQSGAIQDIFERILKRIFKQAVCLIGCSRTDSGVHAKAFVAHLRTDSALPDADLKKALNFYLPKDIVVFSCKTVSERFHARFDAKSKIYRYQIWNHPTRPLFEAPYCYWCHRRLDLLPMRKAAKNFVGEHDFSAFKDAKDKTRTNSRHMKRIAIRQKGHLIRIDFEANGFLTHMVRVLVGTLLEVGHHKLSPDKVQQILLSKNRSLAGPTAKACGLMLLRVKY